MSPAFVDNDGQLNWRKIAYHARSAFAVILALTILIGGGWFAYYKVKETWVAMRSENDYVGEGKDEVVVSIPEGADITHIGDILVQHGVVKSTRTFRNVCARTPAAATLQAGRFRLRTEMSAEAALALLLDPNSKVALTVTLPEGRATAQQWAILMDELGLKEEDLQAAAESSELNLPSWSGGAVEGFLFPDTYQVAEPATALGVLKQQVEQFNKVAGSLSLESKAIETEPDPLRDSHRGLHCGEGGGPPRGPRHDRAHHLQPPRHRQRTRVRLHGALCGGRFQPGDDDRRGS